MRGARASLQANPRVLSVYLLGVFVGALDTNVLGPAFPLIAHGFHVSLAWTAWTVTVYTVTYVASTVLAGALGDAHGRRRLFAAGVAAFAVASLVAALAHSFWLFLAARALQGIGAGAVYPNAQAEGTAQFPASRRGMALGLFGAVFGIAAIIGPNLGGALAQFVGWRWIFGVNVPIAMAALALVPGLPPSATRQRAVPDALGGGLFAAALSAALLALAVPGALKLPALVVAALCVGGVLIRQRTAATPFLDPVPFATRAGPALFAGAMLIGFDMSAAVFVPTLAQRALGFSVMGSGLALMPAALSAAVLSGVGGVAVDRRGPRAVLLVGLGAGTLGGLLLAWPHVDAARFFGAMVALGVSLALTIGAPLNRLAMSLYGDERAGEALSLAAVFRGVGLAAGPVLMTQAQVWYGWSGMFGAVAVACLLAMGLFVLVPGRSPAAGELGDVASDTAG